MKRRDFFRNGSLALIGTSVITNRGFAHVHSSGSPGSSRAKNIIFMVSDGGPCQ